MEKEFTLEEDIKCQNVVNEIYEVLEKYELNAMLVWDEDSKKLKAVDSLSINGSALQINAER